MSVLLQLRLIHLRRKLARAYLQDEVVLYLRKNITSDVLNIFYHVQTKFTRKINKMLFNQSIRQLIKSGRVCRDGRTIGISEPGQWTLFNLQKRYGLAYGSDYVDRPPFDKQFLTITKASRCYTMDFARMHKIGKIENIVTSIEDDVMKLKESGGALKTEILSERTSLVWVIQLIALAVATIGLLITILVEWR